MLRPPELHPITRPYSNTATIVSKVAGTPGPKTSVRTAKVQDRTCIVSAVTIRDTKNYLPNLYSRYELL